KGNYKGWWSRRITKEHRLIYRLEGDVLWINQCRFHYDRR
ncbi:MAG: toxin YoeB, partial [Devosia sp.]|nr:toxin YoeB [Devosia sp.]